jgi:hypothetical protein
MLTHGFYIDDSGTKEYASDPNDYSAVRGKSRYFVFCGALMSLVEAGRFSQKIIGAKVACFGTGKVELKSNWLRIPHERQKHYLTPYGIDDDALNRCVAEVYRLIRDADLMFIAAIVDKLHVQEDYPNPWYAPAIAYELVLQRVQNELVPGKSAAIIIDDMTGATPKGNQYKKNLQVQHLRLGKFGGSLRRSIKFDRIGTQKFVNSAISHLVQISDLAAYNVHRQFNQYGEDWENPNAGPLNMYPYFREISGKFRMDLNDRVQGYGIVKFPLRERVLWELTK